MNFKKNFGNDGEILARKFLEHRGLEILATNFHSKDGEVDIVARENSTIIFVEVKARRTARFGAAIESITDSKIEKIVAAGQKFLRENALENADWRVDAILIDGGKLEWLKGI